MDEQVHYILRVLSEYEGPQDWQEARCGGPAISQEVTQEKLVVSMPRLRVKNLLGIPGAPRQTLLAQTKGRRAYRWSPTKDIQFTI